jgi:NitT/TauT family transport system substrate-binding protein
VTCILLLGCDPWDHQEPLRLGLLIWPPYELAHLARVRGHYDSDRIRLVDYRSPAEMMRAYRYGLVDVMAVTADYFVELRATDDAHRIIMVIDISKGGDALLAQPDIPDGAALQGRRVGLEASALGAHVLLRCLDAHGLSLAQVQPVPVDIPDQARAFLDRRIDAVVTYEPIRTRLLAEGALELCSSRDFRGDIVDVLITRLRTIEERQGDLRHLVDGWMRALDDFRAQPADAAKHMAVREGMTPDEFLAALERVALGDRAMNERLLLAPDPPIHATLARIQGLFLQHHLFAAPFSMDPAVDPRPLGGAP